MSFQKQEKYFVGLAALALGITGGVLTVMGIIALGGSVSAPAQVINSISSLPPSYYDLNKDGRVDNADVRYVSQSIPAGTYDFRPIDPSTIIGANPNPCLGSISATNTLCLTTIDWSIITGTSSTAQVYVSMDGGTKKLFGSGLKGHQQAPWITKGHVYEFSLYRAASSTSPLQESNYINRIRVVKAPGPGYIAAADLNVDGVVNSKDIRDIKSYGFINSTSSPFDLNVDGVLNNKDVKVVSNAIVEKNSASTNNGLADLNADGFLDYKDIVYIRQHGIFASSTVYYDLNSDGKVDSADVKIVSDSIGKPYNGLADINSDGVVNQADVDLVNQYVGH